MKTYTAEEAKKAIWKDLMKGRKAARKSIYNGELSDINLRKIKEYLDIFISQIEKASPFYHEHAQEKELGILHIVFHIEGCKSVDFLESSCICWHRRGPDEFVRSEHLPYAEDAPCRS